MKKRFGRVLKSAIGAVVGSAGLMAATVSHASITFTPFVTSTDLSTALSNDATIGFAYAGDKFVGSVYFGANNSQLYQTNLTGGGVTTFGAPIAGASGEIYVSSSLGLGGFGLRDVFAGSEALSSITRFSNDGTTQSTFVSGLIGGVRSIAFDPYGLYGNDMIVATNAGFVYRVNSAGVATVLATLGEDTEGLSFAPQAFGTVAAGSLVVASEGSGSIRAISPTGTISLITTVASAEMVSFVPLNLGLSGDPLEGFYAAAYPTDIVFAGASEFTPYIGDMIITGETTHGVTDVAWNGTSFVSTNIGTFPAQPEDGIFVTTAILHPGCGDTGTCAVPEPSETALFVTGLGLLGWSLARSRMGRQRLFNR